MYIADFTQDDFKENLKKSDLVIVPIGSLEAHGHHLPLGTDMFSPRLLCRKINDAIGSEVWIAPEIPYGQCFDMSEYPGTVSVSTETLAAYVYEVGKGLYKNGLNKILFLNGHGGNITALNLASEKIVMLGADIITVNWWLDYSKEILTITQGQGHAGEDETSAILYYDEKLVHMDRAGKNIKTPLYRVYFKDRGKTIYKDALSGDATLASKDKGEKIFELLTQKLVSLICDFKAGRYYIE